jgi:hypothetical protein
VSNIKENVAYNKALQKKSLRAGFSFDFHNEADVFRIVHVAQEWCKNI